MDRNRNKNLDPTTLSGLLIAAAIMLIVASVITKNKILTSLAIFISLIAWISSEKSSVSNGLAWLEEGADVNGCWKNAGFLNDYFQESGAMVVTSISTEKYPDLIYKVSPGTNVLITKDGDVKPLSLAGKILNGWKSKDYFIKRRKMEAYKDIFECPN